MFIAHTTIEISFLWFENDMRDGERERVSKRERAGKERKWEYQIIPHV